MTFMRTPNTIPWLSGRLNSTWSGVLTVALIGGPGSGNLVSNFSSLPATSSYNGYLGIALYRVSDGAYVLDGHRPNRGYDWKTITFSQDALSAYVSPTETYALDLIDYRWGGWGWVAMDSVSIPGQSTAVPVPAAIWLFCSGLIGVLGLRRKRPR